MYEPQYPETRQTAKRKKQSINIGITVLLLGLRFTLGIPVLLLGLRFTLGIPVLLLGFRFALDTYIQYNSPVTMPHAGNIIRVRGHNTMTSEKQFCCIIKVTFEERKRNLLGIFIMAGESRYKKVYCCTPLVNYYSDKLKEQTKLSVPWDILLDTISHEYGLLDDPVLSGLSENIRQRFETFSPERADRLLRIIKEINNFTLRNKLMHELIMEDLKILFRDGELEAEVNIELAASVPQALLPVKPKPDDKVQEETETPEKEDEKEPPPEKSPPPKKKKTAKKTKEDAPLKESPPPEKKKVVRKAKEDVQPKEAPPEKEKTAKEADETGESPTGKPAEASVCEVELVVDPIDGAPARQLEAGDGVLSFRTKGVRLPGKVISIAPQKKKPKYLVVRIQLAENIIGKAIILKNALVHVEKPPKQEEPTEQPKRKWLKIVLIITVLLIIAGIVTAVILLF